MHDDRQAGPPAGFPIPAATSRRSFLAGGAYSGAGLLLAPGALAARWLQPTRPPRADAVIHVFLSGGLSHIDTFDPKPDAAIDYRGEFGTVASRADGEPFSEVVPRIAKAADRLTVIRSFTHGEAEHERGAHSVLTGYAPSPVVVYPSLGAVVSHELGGRNDLPAYICVPNGSRYTGTGYLSAAFAPFELGSDPGGRSFAVRDLEAPKGLDAARAERRRQLLTTLDHDFRSGTAADTIDASARFYEQAYALIDAPHARAAFDLGKESKKLRDRYGRTGIGARLLLARRLVEAGARYVTVSDGGYDNHRGIFQSLRTNAGRLDLGFSALIEDLDQRGILDRTLVLLTSEFGRTPRVNRDAGRDHWPRVFSVVAAGGGVRRGYVHGASNAIGSEPERDPVRPADLAATVFQLLGIDPGKRLTTPSNRPIDLVRNGRVLRELLA